MQPAPAVDRSILDLIAELQSKHYMKDFCLVGGTALAIRLGHRHSVDIDLFTTTDFDTGELQEKLFHDFQFSVQYSATNTLKGTIRDIQIDCIAHRYPLVAKPVSEQGLVILSNKDIIAMKLNAISSSGQRVKDFIDIYFLLKNYSLDEMLTFYRQKYSLNNDAIVLKSLIWFEDTDLSDWPLMILEPKLAWAQVKKRLEKAVEKYLKAGT
ncbi:MAG: nucleotidyl transferase AbiEii/AbiGii toxin family protein [Bacteroidetes bacterium]|nr:nucleotidyl transferase AbiEii/AbiGii toxin family protein [Bacteroidota bacterium]